MQYSAVMHACRQAADMGILGIYSCINESSISIFHAPTEYSTPLPQTKIPLLHLSNMSDLQQHKDRDDQTWRMTEVVAAMTKARALPTLVGFFFFLFFLPSEVPKLPQLLDEQLDSSCHIHASCCPRTGLKAATTCFKSLKMSSTND